MPDFPELPIITPPGKPKFPELPIITPDPTPTPRATLREKYGNLYYLAIAGLVISVVLVGTFAIGIYATRDIWAAVYVLGDPQRAEADRVQAAWHLSRHPRFIDAQRLPLALQKTLPDLPRYLIAEGMTADAIGYDPKGYAQMVARSEGWPDWLRLVLIRPMAYGVGEGYRLPWEPLDLLREHKDPAISLWATYVRAAMPPGDPATARILGTAASTEGTFQPLAKLLDAAVNCEGEARIHKLDEATVWTREHAPVVAELWKGWKVENGKLVQEPSK